MKTKSVRMPGTPVEVPGILTLFCVFIVIYMIFGFQADLLEGAYRRKPAWLQCFLILLDLFLK